MWLVLHSAIQSVMDCLSASYLHSGRPGFTARWLSVPHCILWWNDVPRETAWFLFYWSPALCHLFSVRQLHVTVHHRFGRRHHHYRSLRLLRSHSGIEVPFLQLNAFLCLLIAYFASVVRPYVSLLSVCVSDVKTEYSWLPFQMLPWRVLHPSPHLLPGDGRLWRLPSVRRRHRKIKRRHFQGYQRGRSSWFPSFLNAF